MEGHRRKYHWAYDEDPNRGDSKLHLLQDGTWITRERRLLADAACKPKGWCLHFVCTYVIRYLPPATLYTVCTGPKDDRSTAPETWKHRARNPLLFQPDIETTRSIRGVCATSLLLDMSNVDHLGKLTVSVMYRYRQHLASICYWNLETNELVDRQDLRRRLCTKTLVSMRALRQRYGFLVDMSHSKLL